MQNQFVNAASPAQVANQGSGSQQIVDPNSGNIPGGSSLAGDPQIQRNHHWIANDAPGWSLGGQGWNGAAGFVRPPADPEHTVVTLPCMEAAYRRIWIEISHKHKKQRVADNQASRPVQPAAPHQPPI